jgi:hypothetical protein
VRFTQRPEKRLPNQRIPDHELPRNSKASCCKLCCFKQVTATRATVVAWQPACHSVSPPTSSLSPIVTFLRVRVSARDVACVQTVNGLLVEGVRGNRMRTQLLAAALTQPARAWLACALGMRMGPAGPPCARFGVASG